MSEYHNHRGDEEMRRAHIEDAVYTIKALLVMAALVVAFVCGCWLGYRAGYNAALVEMKSR